MSEIYTISIQKGGVGKSTSVQCLGELLGKEQKKRVLCVDTDSQCSLSLASGIANPMDCAANIYTLLKEETSFRDSIVHTPYYDLIPGSPYLANADIEFNKIGKEQFLRERITGADYDIILIDTPPALSLMSIMALTACDYVLIPMSCDYLTLAGADQLYATIETIKKYLNPNIIIRGIMIIKFNPRTNLTNLVLNSIIEYADNHGTEVFDSKIRETVKIKEAQSQLKPICDWASKATAVNDYRDLIKEIF